jgi:5-methyltetrahydrofolate--homocysteine methyltransferase
MIIIGEKINGSVPLVARAIEERDENAIRRLALRQAEAGADYLDVAAGTGAELERHTLEWLIGIVQDTVDTPLCIDSPDPQVLIDMLPIVKKPGILNSVSEERGKCELVFPHIADSEWKIIALTCDNNGITSDVETRLGIAAAIIDKAAAYDIARDRLFIDPLITALCTNENSLSDFTGALTMIKKRYPDIHITGGLSNISYGMPCRRLINQQFLTLAMAAGMDSAIMDPASAAMRSALYAAEAVLGNDRNCRTFLSAYRKGLIGPPKKETR